MLDSNMQNLLTHILGQVCSPVWFCFAKASLILYWERERECRFRYVTLSSAVITRFAGYRIFSEVVGELINTLCNIKANGPLHSVIQRVNATKVHSFGIRIQWSLDDLHPELGFNWKLPLNSIQCPSSLPIIIILLPRDSDWVRCRRSINW